LSFELREVQWIIHLLAGATHALGSTRNHAFARLLQHRQPFGFRLIEACAKCLLKTSADRVQQVVEATHPEKSEHLLEAKSILQEQNERACYPVAHSLIGDAAKLAGRDISTQRKGKRAGAQEVADASRTWIPLNLTVNAALEIASELLTTRATLAR